MTLSSCGGRSYRGVGEVRLGDKFVVSSFDDVLTVYRSIFADMKDGLSEFVTPMLNSTDTRLGHLNGLRFAYEVEGKLKGVKVKEEEEDRCFKLWKTLTNPNDARFRLFIFESFKVLYMMLYTKILMFYTLFCMLIRKY